MQRMPPAQRLPHAPQWAMSVCGLTQRHPQRIVDAEHAPGPVQTPAQHDSPLAQALPHAPQWLELEVVDTSQPFASEPSQSAKPAEHARRQAPATQLATMFGRVAQAMSQPPQCAALVSVVTQTPPQSEAGGRQVTALQVPETHR
jgi:hypothetical protein